MHYTIAYANFQEYHEKVNRNVIQVFVVNI